MNICTDHISIETTHGRSQLYPSAIRTIIDLQNLVPSPLGCVIKSLTYASWYNLYIQECKKFRIQHKQRTTYHAYPFLEGECMG